LPVQVDRFVGGDGPLRAGGDVERGGSPAGRVGGPLRVGLGSRDLDDGRELIAGELARERDVADRRTVGKRTRGLDEGAGA
jgi:hypothetical protein